jgi:5S rRNA maturation endonuclease (ribonuclease M5)
MLESIQQSVLQLLPARKKTGQNGWTSFNAPCCVHNGETADTRGRGGIKTNAGAVSYHCFNCGFKASFVPGRHLTFKFRKLLAWLGADDLTVRRLVIDAVRLRELVAPEDLAKEPEQEIVYEKRELPEGAVSFSQWTSHIILQGETYDIPEQVVRGVEYVYKRGISTNADSGKYEFYLTENEAYNLHRRVIVPYYYQGDLVGYTARAIEDGIKPKYWSSHPADFVFNLDMQKPDSKFVIVCEGPFDAMSIDGVAVSGSELSDTQIEQIDRLQREVIVVPDADRAGRKLIDRAIEAGWTVSFPVWQETCKDINDAVVKHGKLFVLKCILDARETSRLKIELKKKKLYA